MLRGKKYYTAEGYQIAMYFMEVMTITQGAEGSFSHRGTKNMDEAGNDQFIDPAFAPFDGTITWKQVTGDKTGILFSSDNPVWTKAFGLVFVNLLMWHDNSTAELFKGKKIKQGEHLYDEGTAGRATGNHIHYGVSIGPFKGGYPLVKNEFGNWELPNEVNAWDVFFVNDTIIRKSGGYPWEVFIGSVDPKPEPTDPTNFKVGDLVQIVGDYYTTGEKVPIKIKAKKYKINKIFQNKARLEIIFSWVYLKDLKKV